MKASVMRRRRPPRGRTCAARTPRARRRSRGPWRTRARLRLRTSAAASRNPPGNRPFLPPAKQGSSGCGRGCSRERFRVRQRLSQPGRRETGMAALTDDLIRRLEQPPSGPEGGVPAHPARHDRARREGGHARAGGASAVPRLRAGARAPQRSGTPARNGLGRAGGLASGQDGRVEPRQRGPPRERR